MTPVLLLALFAPRLDADRFPLPAETVCRVGSARFRTGDQIIHLKFLPGGRTLMFAGWSELTAWDVATGRRTRRHVLPERTGNESAVEPAADGSVVLVREPNMGEELRAFALDPTTGRILWQTKLPTGDKWALATGGRWVAVRLGANVAVFDTRTGAKLAALRFSQSDKVPDQIAVSADGKVVAAVWDNQWVEALDTATGAVRFAKGPPANGELPSTLILSPDGRWLVWATKDVKGYTLRLEDLAEKRSEDLNIDPRYYPGDGAFSANGRRLTVLGHENKVRLFQWSVPTGRPEHVYPERVYPECVHAQSLYRSAVSPDGRTVAVAGEYSAVLWEADTGRRLPQSADQTPTGLTALADSQRLAVNGPDLRVFDMGTGREERRFTGDREYERAASLSPDGRTLAVATPDQLQLIDTDTGLPRRELTGPFGRMPGVQFTADGRTLLGTGLSDGKVLKVWDVTTGRPYPPLVALDGAAASWLFSADGRTAVGLIWRGEGILTGWTTAVVRDTQAGRNGATFQFTHLAGQSFELSPDGRLLAVPGMLRDDPTIGNVPSKLGPTLPTFLTVFDLTTGRKRPGFRTKEASGPYTFSADSRILATATHNDTVELWEVASGRRMHVFQNTGRVEHLAFAPDGATLAAASPEAPVYVWDVRGTLRRFPDRLDRPALDRLWQALGEPDAPAAFDAVRRLAAAPADAVPFLADRLDRPPPADRVTTWLAALDAPRFADREAAERSLTAVAELVEPRLRAELLTTTSAEARRRLTVVLATPGRPRHARAMEALGWMNTPAAKELRARFP